MNNIRIILSMTLAAGLVLSLLAAPALFSTTDAARADANQNLDRVQKFRVSGIAAEASWFIENPAEETFTGVYMLLSDAASKDYDLNESFLDVFIIEYGLVEECEEYEDDEECYYEYEPVMEFFGYAEFDKSDYKISKNLRSATVNGVQLDGYDYVSDELKTITVDATWFGEGSLIKEKQSYSESNEDYKISYKLMGTGRDAHATAEITGDIDLDLDQADDHDASILKVRQGYMIRVIGNPV